MTRDSGAPPWTAIGASRLLVLALAVVLAAGLTACSSDGPSSGSGGGSGKIAVKAGESTCQVATGSLGAGTHTFAVTNTGTQVTEFYVYAPGDRVMGEVENIGPSLTRELTVELPAGDYQTACKPGQVGKGIRGKLTVTGTHQDLSSDDKLAAAVASYQRYVRSQSAALIERCTEFVEAVKAGDIEQGQAAVRAVAQLLGADRAGGGDLRRSRPPDRRARERRRAGQGVHRLPPDREGPLDQGRRERRRQAGATSCSPT